MEVLCRLKNRMHAKIKEILNTSCMFDGHPVGSEVECIHKAKKEMATTSVMFAGGSVPCQMLDACANERHATYIYRVGW
jgi:phosphoribosylformimino-5-aminoimidazole carboxamide ribonucleotide (ProFAR) isomerase